MEFETLEITRDGHIAHVAFNRPDRLNAMNVAMFGEVGKVFHMLDDDPSVRAIILSGNGKHFTAGLDLKESGAVLGGHEGDPARVREKFRRHVLWLQSCFTAIDVCRAPVIAAVHGACIGAGVDVITACDIRLSTENSWFTIQEVNVGITADVGTLQRAPHVLPLGIVKELAYTGRKMLPDEALRLGFINHTASDKAALIERAFSLAQEIASKSPLAVAGTKAVLNHARDHSVADGLDYVATWNSGQLIGEDLMKAATASMMKQEAEFDDLLASDHSA